MQAFLAGLCVVVAMLVVGCGGGGGGNTVVYNQAGFVSCLKNRGSTLVPSSAMTADQRSKLASISGTTAAHFVGGQLPTGQYAGFFVGTNNSDADAIEKKVKAFLASPLASPGKLGRKGNVIELLPLHETFATGKLLNACLGQAREQ